MKNKTLKYFLMMLAMVSLMNCKKEKDDTGTPSETTTQSNLDIFREKCLSEINYARTNPIGYAEQRLKDDYIASSDNGAYLDIKSRPAVGTLALQSQLNTSANKYALILLDSGALSHTYNGTTPTSRANAEGYNFSVGENIGMASSSSYNADLNPETAAIQTVKLFIIDDGVPNLGHRNNVMLVSYKKIGFGFRHDALTQYNYWVEDFGVN